MNFKGEYLLVVEPELGHVLSLSKHLRFFVFHLHEWISTLIFDIIRFLLWDHIPKSCLEHSRDEAESVPPISLETYHRILKVELMVLNLLKRRI